LLQVIGDRTLTAIDMNGPTGVRGAVELCVRHAQLPSGRRALAEQLALWAAEPAADEDNFGGLQAAAGTAQDAVARLAGWLDELPQRAGISQWIAALERLAQQAGLLPSRPNAESAELWSRVVRGLRSAAQLDEWIGDHAEQLDASGAAGLLADTAADLPAPQHRDATGRVRVLSADAARHTRPRHLFVGGLSEESFPVTPPLAPPHRAEGEEFADDDLAPSEMLLFYQLVTRPTESLTLSYAALDAKAQPLPPSPLLVELERCFGDVEVPRTVQSLGYLAPLAGEPLSRSDLRRDAVLAAQERRRELLASMVRSPGTGDVANSIIDGIEAVASRGRRQDFGAFEGMCGSEAALKVLSERYGAQYLWSPSRLETYAVCPFRFFGEYLLKLAPLPELALESDMARRGSLLHDTLARLYQRLAAAEPAAPPPPPEAVAENFHQELQSLAGARPGRGLDAALREIERRQIAAWATQFAAQHDEYCRAWAHLDVPLVATHFEVRFGKSNRRADEPPADAGLSTETPFELEVAGETLRFGGQIDRIDVGRVGDTTVFNVIDYKTGVTRLREEDLAAGKQLQLPLYAMAVAELLLAEHEAAGLAAGYWSVRGKGFNLGARSGGPMALGVIADGAVRPAEAWLAQREALIERIREIVASIRQGWFPVFNDDLQCARFCPFNTACRITHVRSLEKQWTPPAEFGIDLPHAKAQRRKEE
jgi:RecB family exonuclease